MKPSTIWVHIFGSLGVLRHAIEIGTAVRLIAWAGFLATLVWFSWEQHRLQVTGHRSQGTALGKL